MSKLIINCETGETVTRDLTDEELNQQEVDATSAALIEEKEKEKAEAKIALFEKLGITSEEAKLLLG